VSQPAGDYSGNLYYLDNAVLKTLIKMAVYFGKVKNIYKHIYIYYSKTTSDG